MRQSTTSYVCGLLLVVADAVLAQNGKLTVVRTANELSAALNMGAEHIMLQDHIDLTKTQPVPLCPGGECDLQVMFHVKPRTRSIRV
jgi:hypothetical protein